MRTASVPNSPSNQAHFSFSAIVVSIAPDRCSVDLDGRALSCPLPDPRRIGRLAVGDRVALDAAGVRVVGVAPRRSLLSRPDPRAPERELLIAANVDVVVIVASVAAPRLVPRLVDRYWIAAEHAGAEALLAVNKIDLAGAERDEALLPIAPHRAAGLAVVPTSTATGEGIDALAAAIGGRTAVFVGHSGVGKSSLANALLAGSGSALETGRVNASNKKGRHTTTASSLHRLAGGGVIIDTPGVRSFGLWAVDARSLAGYFPDFEAFAPSCKFGDCAHDKEPRCAVRDAAESGAIGPARYDTYLRLLASLGE
jgi:ribosome biogenesis GTPase / thiamine phosphate phosphatase